jgi:hypothetical protein
MSYMRGDYMGGRGDYMGRGDPNIFGFFGGLAKKALGGIPFAGPLISSILPASIDVAARAVTSKPSFEPNALGKLLGMHGTGGGATGTNPANLPARIPQNMPMVPTMVAGAAPGMRRHHPNKSTYVTRGGGTSHWPPGLEVHVKGTELVPTRRMNVANPRALRRSLRRVAGFAKLTKRVRRAVSMAASAVGVHHRRGKAPIRRR